MALEENNGSGMVMPVGPMYGGGNGFGGGFGGDYGWIILFLIFGMFGGGWGNGMGMNGGMGGLYPWLNNSNQINDGFRDQMMNTTLTGIQTAVTTGFGNAEVAACNRAMNDLERSFASQTALTQNLNTIAMNQQNCCCENRAAIADLKYTIANEACADRAAVTASTQRILDQMCQDKIDQKNEKIQELQNQLAMAQFLASQNAQTAAIVANNEAQTTALEQYLAPVPRPAYVVQNPSCCNNGCGCGNY